MIFGAEKSSITSACLHEFCVLVFIVPVNCLKSIVSPAACCLSWHLLWLADNKVCSYWKMWMSCLEGWDVCFALKKVCSRTDLLSRLYSCNMLGASCRWLHFRLECHTKWTQMVGYTNCRASSQEHLDIWSGIWHWLSPAFVGSRSRDSDCLRM